ncbi:MAG TPA: type II toxin-antitoxin system prevent-host-death family antitoxin [Bryobacteraceae bacterium]|nr:type II toxin-antitoxin system prevent-host-death family antitoxin [Bryobacteraceae bacterium]
MAIEKSYSDVRAHLAEYMDRVVDDRDVVVVRRRNGKNVALIAEDELSSMMETFHLMSSPKNAQRLLTALRRAEGGSTKPQTIDELRSDLGLAER